MTAKEYFSQAKYLDQRINYHLKEAQSWRELACGITSPGLRQDKVQTSPKGEAPFIRAMERVWEMEQKINDEIDRLVDLKEQMQQVIGQLDNADYQLILKYRYFQNMTWRQIGDVMCIDRTTAQRYHDAAIARIVVPANAIMI